MSLGRVVGIALLVALAACGPTAPPGDMPDAGTGDRPVLMSVDITPPTPMIATTTTVQLTATGTYSDSTTADLSSTVTWSSSQTSAASIDATGLVTGVGTGRTQITATSGGISGMAVVTVSGATLMALAVTPSQPTVPIATTEQLVATGTFSDNSTQDMSAMVTWASATPGVASVSARGLLTAAGAGTSMISAQLGSITGSTSVTVTSSTLRSIVITPAIPGVPVGFSRQLVATGNFSDGTTKDLTPAVTWSSSNSSLATVSTGGLAAGVAVGTPTITANLGAVNSAALFKVSTSSLSAIAVTPANNIKVVVGQTQAFTALATFADATTLDVTTQITWSSSASTVASISNAARSNGLATGLGAGTATISATRGAVVGSASLAVTTSPLTSIAVTPATATIGTAQTQQFTATGTYADHSTADITTQSALTWTSSAMATATISNADGSRGLATSVAVGGPVTVTAQLGTISGTAKLTVTAAKIVSIALTPATMTIPSAGTQPYVATATLSDTTTQDVTTNASWASSDPTIATVSAGGLAMATATGSGTVSITAKLGSVTGTAMLTVAGAVCDGLAISQIYGGGGNAGATYDQDFVELFNEGSMDVSLKGRSVQYASAAGSTWIVGALPDVTVPAGGYYLVGMIISGAGGDDLPVDPDVTFPTINMSAISGKVALVNDTTPLTGQCPMGSQDFVGYGSADCPLDGDTAPALESDASAARETSGCTNSGDNFDDFDINFFEDNNSVSPRSSATSPNVCAAPICL